MQWWWLATGAVGGRTDGRSVGRSVGRSFGRSVVRSVGWRSGRDCVEKRGGSAKFAVHCAGYGVREDNSVFVWSLAWRSEKGDYRHRRHI